MGAGPARERYVILPVWCFYVLMPIVLWRQSPHIFLPERGPIARVLMVLTGLKDQHRREPDPFAVHPAGTQSPPASGAAKSDPSTPRSYPLREATYDQEKRGMNSDDDDRRLVRLRAE